MSEPSSEESTRELLRKMLREMMPEALPRLSDARNGSTSSDHWDNGQGAPDQVPLVPAPPVAAVLRPSTWSGPPVPGEIVGSGMAGSPTTELMRSGDAPRTPAPAGGSSAPQTPPSGPSARLVTAAAAPLGGRVETVRIDSDDDLQAFVRSMVTRLESPRDRLAIKAGRLHFQLQRSAAPAGSPGVHATPVMRLAKGAVTERHVREAHASGARLLLARAAVLTPLARDTARALSVQIEKESRC